MLNIQELRREYQLRSLDISDLNPSPFLQFSLWFHEAQQGKVLDLDAMALATANLKGRPSCRTILLKGVDRQGFLFFTNYDSRKGKDLSQNPYACATFYWRELERQIIIDGRIEKLNHAESTEYFASRPRGTQLGTWASHQDQILHSREELEQNYHYFEEKYREQTIPMPSYWGGYRLLPERFEFWQGRLNRLHDRFSYHLFDHQWQIFRLAP